MSGVCNEFLFYFDIRNRKSGDKKDRKCSNTSQNKKRRALSDSGLLILPDGALLLFGYRLQVLLPVSLTSIESDKSVQG